MILSGLINYENIKKKKVKIRDKKNEKRCKKLKLKLKKIIIYS